MWILPHQLLTRWNGSTGMEGTIWELDELSRACASSLVVRSKPTRRQTWLLKLKREPWTRFLFGRIAKPSHAKYFGDWWTSLLRATPAKVSPLRGTAKELAILGSYGLGLSVQQSLFAPGEFFSRTSRAISRLDSPQSLATWKKQVIAQRGEYSLRLKLELRNSEKECLSWQTARVSRGGYTRDPGTKKERLTLEGQVKFKREWATPAANKLNGTTRADFSVSLAKQVNWATPQCHDSQAPKTPEQIAEMRERSGAGVMNLNEQVAAWPTPCLTDGSKAPKFHKGGNMRLPYSVKCDGQPAPASPSTNGNRPGQLNPDWVETLMGLPAGWTAYASAGTELSPPQQSELTENLRGDWIGKL